MCLNDETLALLDHVRSDASRSAYLRRLLLLAVGPVFDDELTEHLVVRLSQADLGRIQIAKAPSQGEREYVLDLIRAAAGAARSVQSTYYAPVTPPVSPPKP